MAIQGTNGHFHGGFVLLCRPRMCGHRLSAPLWSDLRHGAIARLNVGHTGMAGAGFEGDRDRAPEPDPITGFPVVSLLSLQQPRKNWESLVRCRPSWPRRKIRIVRRGDPHRAGPVPPGSMLPQAQHSQTSEQTHAGGPEFLNYGVFRYRRMCLAWIHRYASKVEFLPHRRRGASMSSISWSPARAWPSRMSPSLRWPTRRGGQRPATPAGSSRPAPSRSTAWLA